jgi:hypothetical protein
MREVLLKTTEKEESKSIYFLILPAKSESYLERKISKFISNYNQPVGEYFNLPSSPKDFAIVLKKLTDEYQEA